MCIRDSYKVATKETKDILRGKYGATVKPFNEEVKKKVLGDDPDTITCRPADLIPDELDTLRKECEPVSYTHLDVYKRQIRNREMMAMWVCHS